VTHKRVRFAFPFLATGALAAVLAGCSKSSGRSTLATAGAGADGPRFDSRPANAPRQGPVTSRDLAFVRYSIDVSKELPRACLAFNTSLDPQKDYSPFIAVSPQTPIALSVEGEKLCVGGLTFGRARDVIIRTGLPAADGRVLAADATVNVEFGDRPAYVGFKGDGVVLPRVDADGLAVETVNVDKVTVTVSRITDRALAFKTISSGSTTSPGDYAYFYEASNAADVKETLWTGTMATPGSPNVAATTVFPIAKAVPKLRAGAYFIELSQADSSDKAVRQGARANRWLIITDLALTTYSGLDGMSATVRSLHSAKPLTGITLELVAKNNEVLARGQSDGDGHVRFPGSSMRGPGNLAPKILTAYGSDGDFAVLDLDRPPVDLSERDVTGRAPAGTADAFVYTERGIYRPGETVRGTALIRDAAAAAMTARPGALVVYGPNGLEAGRQRFDNESQAGLARFDFTLPNAAARGAWRMAAFIDGLGQVGAVGFSVEDFVPQRIKLELKTDADAPLRKGDTRPVDASVRFLYGAPGAGLRVEGSVRVEPDPSPFPPLKDFVFGRYDERFREASFDLPAATTDGGGKATIVVDPAQAKAADSSRPLRLRTVLSAIEPGGRAVRDDVRIPYRPAERYLALKPAVGNDPSPQGKPASFEVVAVDRRGAVRAATLTWRVVRIDYRYDWYRAEEGGAWQWRSSRRLVEIQQGTTRIADGQRATVTTRDLDWGSYDLLLTDSTTGAEASIGFHSGYGGRVQEGNVEAPDTVRIGVPSALPAVGGNLTIGLESPYAGEAEVVVASESVLLTRTMSVKASGTTVTLPVTKDWGPGVYVMASVYTPRDPVQRPQPRRAIGVAHVAVDTAPRTFKLALKAPDVQRPRGKLTVDVTSTSGPPEDTYLALAAVDEGILLLTGYQSPDPVKYFFGRRRLGVDLRDDYGRLLDPNQGAAAAVRQGGDSIGGAGLTVVPTRTVALFSGPVKLRNGKASVTLDVPDFNGELRLMAVAWSASGLGAASQPLTVRDPVPVEMIVPRFLAPGDDAIATVAMNNIEGAAGQYRASITSMGPLVAATPTVQATLSKGQRQDLAVSITSKAEGVSTVALQVTGPANVAIAHSFDIQTRSPYLPASEVVRHMLQPGESWTPDAKVLAPFVPGSGSLKVSFSPVPMDPAALFDSLDRYPYGCTEQIVSRAMPLLYANQMAVLAGRKTATEIRNQIQDAISVLLNRQGSDGAIGLWRVGDQESTPWLGAYAVDFLARAKALGYVVPDAALDKAYDGLTAFTSRDDPRSTGYAFEVVRTPFTQDTSQLLLDRSTAYGAYVLARAGRTDKSRLRYLHDARLDRIPSPLARAQIGGALYMIGDNARAKSAFDQAERALGYRNTSDYYATPHRDLAGVLALAAEAKMQDRVVRLTSSVSQALPAPDRLTTQEKAFLLLAAAALSNGQTTVNVQVAGATEQVTAGRVFMLSEAQSKTPPTFTNRGSGQVWLTSVARGAPAQAPPPASEGLTLDKQLWMPDGRPASGTSFAQGARVIVALTVRSALARAVPLIMADLLPAGFEIEAVLRPTDAGKTGPYAFLGDLAVPKVAEARDDRLVAAISLENRMPATVAYIVRAVTPGRFAMPGAVAEDMYRLDTFARTSAQTITIAKR
jgi:uncharacterized protein YfaS (alpha-2-macroglobulin family)